MDCAFKYRLRTLIGFLLFYALLVALIPLLLPIAIDLFKDQGQLIRSAGMGVTFFVVFMYMLYLIDRYRKFKRRFTAELNAAHDWQLPTGDTLHPPKLVCQRCGSEKTGAYHGNQAAD